MSTESHKRRWFQFRLRTLLILIAVFGVGFAWLAHERQQIRERREWLKQVKIGFIEYEKPPTQPAWLRALLGDDSATDVIKLEIADSKFTDAGMVHLACLTKLKGLSLANTQITDAGLVHLAGLTELEYLDLSYTKTKVTDAGLVHIAGLTNLKYLILTSTQITDAGMVHLAGLTNLTDLWLDNTQVTRAGLPHLAGLTNLKFLVVLSTPLMGDGLQKLLQSLPKTAIPPNP